MNAPNFDINAQMSKDIITKVLTDHDKSRPRSLQTAIGVSSLGDCRRKVWLTIQGTPKTNQSKSLPAIMGTAIHAQIEKSLGAIDGVLIEHRVEIDDLPPATIDYFNTVTGEIVDWKTITLKNRDYFVTQQKRWQVQTYGYLLTKAGFDVKQVTLVGIPRDGTEDDILVHSEPYDESVALAALQWLDDLRQRTDAPAPERDAFSFCRKYCDFYGACTGIPKDLIGEIITDDLVTKAAKRYLELKSEIALLESEQDGVKTALAGVSGVTFDGIKISWSEVAGRKTPDTEVIKAMLGDVPMKQGDPSIRLTVK